MAPVALHFCVHVENTQLDDIIIKIIPENANYNINVYFKLITIQVRLLPRHHPDL